MCVIRLQCLRPNVSSEGNHNQLLGLGLKKTQNEWASHNTVVIMLTSVEDSCTGQSMIKKPKTSQSTMRGFGLISKTASWRLSPSYSTEKVDKSSQTWELTNSHYLVMWIGKFHSVCDKASRTQYLSVPLLVSFLMLFFLSLTTVSGSPVFIARMGISTFMGECPFSLHSMTMLPTATHCIERSRQSFSYPNSMLL